LSDTSSLIRPHSIVFFDGVCGLCNASVDFILTRDSRLRFRFAPLQGDTARQELPPADWERLDTLILLTPQGSYRRSAAVVRILWGLPGVWPTLGTLLWLIPKPLRDLGYRIVSANRLQWFGKKETCRLPTLEERDRFLP
jgi:predicted DCC family thiol-disulfide oxidoreductase YuxK